MNFRIERYLPLVGSCLLDKHTGPIQWSPGFLHIAFEHQSIQFPSKRISNVQIQLRNGTVTMVNRTFTLYHSF